MLRRAILVAGMPANTCSCCERSTKGAQTQEVAIIADRVFKDVAAATGNSDSSQYMMSGQRRS